ncbi:MAG TPA: ATP-grasp domain-containing protein [Saprospiraceae bacterium]|nr:ATP-grasp domain-containing protein [Saprospiraceae bacterium]
MKSIMNILITCAGRRNYLVDYFREALNPLGGKVHVFNTDPHSAAYWLADVRVLSPFATDPTYPAFLENYCISNDIRAVLSCMDVDLGILAGAKEKFARLGITILVADPWVIDMAHDKWLTQQFLIEHQFPVSSLFLDLDKALDAIKRGEEHYPFFVKPRWGMGSIALFKAETEEDLIFYFEKTKQLITGSYSHYGMARDESNAVLIQGMLPGQEYGLDIINDLEGNHQVTVVKKKLAMRSGETDIAITEENKALEELGAKIASLTRHPANLDVDVFWDGEKAYVLELNPRFGGGYPFSHAAGINLPQAIVAWLQNEIVNKAELLTSRYGVEAMKGITMVVKNE